MSTLSELLPSGGGGSTVDFVASGTLPNGKPVILKADGTVTAIASIVEEAGTSAVFETGETVYISGAYDSANEKVVIAYQTQLGGGYGRVVVGTVSGNSISFGTVVTFASAATDYISTMYDPDSGKVVIAYGSADYGNAIVGTVSGTSISFGTPVVFVTSTQARYMSLTYDLNSNKVVLFYRVGTDSGKGKARVGTVSGTSISFGTEVVFNNGYTEECSSTFDSTNNKVVVAFLDGSNSDYGTAIVGTVSGTNISFGSEVVFNSNTTNQISAVFDTANNKVVIAYFALNNSSYGTAIVGTISGTAISFGSQVVFNAASTHHVSAVFDSANGKVVIGYRDVGNSSYGTAIAGTVSGTSISFATESVFESAYSAWVDAIYDSTNSKVVFGFRDEGNSNKGTGVVFQVGSTNLTASNFVGTSTKAYTNGQTATIAVQGGLSTNQTGLTIGSTYYLQDDGRIAAGVENAPYDISSATYDSKVFNAGSQESASEGLAFSVDGTKMYTVGSGSDTVYEYNLATAFDISTAAYNSVSFSVASQETTPAGLDFSSDGTKMYIAGYTTDTVFQYTLSTAFDLSTASYASISFDVSSQENGLQFVVFNSDGSKMYIRGFTNNTFFQYSLSTAYNVSTASYDSVTFSPTAQGSQPISLAFNADGTKCFVADGNTDAIFQYSLSSAYNVGTASYDSISLSIVNQNNQPKDIAFSTDGTRLFLIGQSGGSFVYQYSTTALAYSTTVKAGKALSATTLLLKDL